jgi:hypothetical protein
MLFMFVISMQALSAQAQTELTPGQPVDLQSSGLTETFTFTGSPTDVLVLAVDKLSPFGAVQVVVRDGASGQVLANASALFIGVRFRFPPGPLNYRVSVTGQQANESVAFRICVGPESGGSACPPFDLEVQAPPAAQPTMTPFINPTVRPELNFNLQPNFGSTILTYSSPDPLVVPIVSGGSVNVSYLGNECVGFAATAPDYSVTLQTTPGFLRFYFDGDGDTTMVIRQPNGAFACNDDTPNSLNPGINFNGPEQGRYDIWVGSYDPTMNIRGNLTISGHTTTPER